MRKCKDGKMKFYRWEWGSFYPKFDAFHITFGPASYFDNRFYIHCYVSQIACLLAFPFIGMNWYALFLLLPFFYNWGALYLHIPFIRSKWDECDPPRYGIYYYNDKGHEAIWLQWGRQKCKSFHMPWSVTWMRTSCLRTDGGWEHDVAKNYPGSDLKQRMAKDFWNKERWKDILWTETYPYKYVLKNGTVQERTATLRVEEREWRQRWLTFTGWKAKVRKTISVEFNDEVGEETGSWKGGTTGCGYDMLPDETPEQCLRRMEKERIFD